MNKYNLKQNSYSACIDIRNYFRIQFGKFESWDKHISMKHIIYIKNNNPTKINLSGTKLHNMIGDV